MSEGVDRQKVPLGDGFFLLFFISADSSIECQSEAHLDARLEPRPVRIPHASVAGQADHLSPRVGSASRDNVDSATGVRF
jgi:hypothetical protein